MRTEKWNGHDIRFVEINGEWWAVMKDVSDALNVFGIWECDNIAPDDIDTIMIDGESVDIINELAIYDRFSRSNSTKARKFRRWSSNVMRKLRSTVGLEPYEVFRMLDKDIQDDIDQILDTLYYDPERGKLTQSITVAGGDVEQIEFE